MMKLNAYRFSQRELNKMIWLKELFENNYFVIERFPEVYYDTFDNAYEVFESLKGLKEKFRFEEDTPDYLGVYIPRYTNKKCKNDCKFEIVNEGVIVLFEDKIREASVEISSKLSISSLTVEDSIRFLVLCHELGHWLTHWPSDASGSRWTCGYYYNYNTGLPDIITHESLAQLITYWCADGQPLDESILKDFLTPTNPNSAYNKYLALVSISKSEILKKLSLLRGNMGCDSILSDETAYELLKSDFIKEICDYAFEHSIRKLTLETKNIKALNIEIINQFILYRFGKSIEYDYILCLIEKEGILNDHAKEILKFEKRFCT